MSDRTLLINGAEVPIPTADTYDLDEAALLYDYTGITIDQVLLDDEVATRLDPKLMKAIVHIAVRRALPDMTDDEITAAIGKVKVADLISAVAPDREEEEPEEEEDPDRPPAEAPADARKSGDSTNTSGTGSETSSDPPEHVDPETSGTPESDSSRSPRIRSVA